MFSQMHSKNKAPVLGSYEKIALTASRSDFALEKACIQTSIGSLTGSGTGPG